MLRFSVSFVNKVRRHAVWVVGIHLELLFVSGIVEILKAGSIVPSNIPEAFGLIWQVIVQINGVDTIRINCVGVH